VADSGSPTGDRGRSAAHETHDPELIVALLDADVTEADRAMATALLADCRSCAALHADIVALARATVEIPTPDRPREFTLTQAMVDSLGRATSGEPVASAARLSSEMHDSRSRHASHDRLLIANLIDRSVDEAERARAEELLAACRECEQLYDDLVSLSAATRSMVAPARPRDFALTDADAERLRVRGWRRLIGAIGSSRDAFSRPLALGLTTLGIAGLLFATIPSVFMASGPTSLSAVGTALDGATDGAGANPEMAAQTSEAPPAGEDRGPSYLAAAPSAAASAAAEALPAPTDGDLETNVEDEPDGIFVGGESSPLAGEPQSDEASRQLANEDPVDRSTMVMVAGMLLVVGVGLFLLRWTARRLGDG
jgi:anti-sigma factor RsiW